MRWVRPNSSPLPSFSLSTSSLCFLKIHGVEAKTFTVWSWKVAAAKSDLIIFDGMIHQLFLSDIPYTINTFIELVELVRSKNRNPCLFAMTCWSLWNRRKKVRMNEVVLAMERLFDQVVQLLQEFQNAHPAQPKSVHPVRPPWKSLDPSELKTLMKRCLTTWTQQVSGWWFVTLKGILWQLCPSKFSCHLQSYVGDFGS